MCIPSEIMPSMTFVNSALQAVDFVIALPKKLAILAETIARIFFDCLYDHENDKNETIRLPSAKEIHAIQNKPPKKKTLKDSQTNPYLKQHSSDCYQEFIEKHLEPYFSGKINKENDNQNRPALIHQFLETPQAKSEQAQGKSQVEMEDQLLSIYIKEAAKALNRYKLQTEFSERAGYGRVMLIQPAEYLQPAEQKQFIRELTRVLKIDFRGRIFKAKDIEKRAFKALRELYEEAHAKKASF